MTLGQLSAFLGWLTVLNIVFLGASWIIVLTGRRWMNSIIVRLLPLPEERLNEEYLHWLARYELLIYFFNLMPWLALQLIR